MRRGNSKERTTAHNLHYHFIWYPKYRKNVINHEVTDRLETLIKDKANELDLEIIELAMHPDHVHPSTTGHPKLAPNQIIQQIKGSSSRILREEFDFGLPSLWTGSYFVCSADEVSSQTMEEYNEAQTGQ